MNYFNVVSVNLTKEISFTKFTNYFYCIRVYILLSTHAHTVCPGLPSPANGMISSSDVAMIGDTVFYSCNVGFVLTGPLTRICTLNGWNGTEPTCEGNYINVFTYKFLWLS